MYFPDFFIQNFLHCIHSKLKVNSCVAVWATEMYNNLK